MAKGSCLCGRVAFAIDDAGVVAAVACYCTNCRKISGSEFGVYLQVRHAAFHWLAGEDEVAAYESSPGNRRGHCRTCGSVAPIATAYGAVRVPAGALDEDPGRKPDAIIFADSKARWCSLDDAGHHFADAGPPDFWRTMITKLYTG